MWNYTEKVMDHFLHPRNVGEIADPDAVGEVGNIVCGDALKLFLKLDAARQRVVDARFQTFGCASAIASASALTELIKGKTVAEASKVTNQDIAHYLGELPEAKMHCSVMGMEALQAAFAKLRKEAGETVAEPAAVAHDETYDPHGLDRTVCFCFSVTERKIRDVILANGLKDVEQVTHYCKAGGGCGGCRPEIEQILKKLQREQPVASPAASVPPEAKGMTNLQRMMAIQKAVDDEIRPALKADGGDLELVDIAGDKVLVKLRGSCAGCPSAHITLKRWVEARLRERVSKTLVVEEA